jgi:hypothetical protein
MTRDNTGKVETVRSGVTVTIGAGEESDLLLFERQ